MSTRFAMSDEDAQKRYEKYKSQDPFPEIPPGLLNSADIADYVAATGMLYPFVHTKGKLKAASYEVDMLGRVLYWTAEGNRFEQQLDHGNDFELQSNSIAFVQCEPRFRLPDYIAVRFNLKITHVYRGILLGTGPLVDPGFVGALFIPLHNLTNNTYKLVGGEGLIWMEFTKLYVPACAGRPEVREERTGVFVPFPDDKKNQPLEYYIRKANPHGAIRSSIPKAFQDSKVAAERAESAAKKTFWLTTGAAVALFISLTSLHWSFSSLNATISRDAKKRQRDLEITIEENSREIEALKTELDHINREALQRQTPVPVP